MEPIEEFNNLVHDLTDLIDKLTYINKEIIDVLRVNKAPVYRIESANNKNVRCLNKVNNAGATKTGLRIKNLKIVKSENELNN